MERDFRSMYLTGEYSPAEDPYFLQLVSLNPERALLPFLDHQYHPSLVGSLPELEMEPVSSAGDLQAIARGKQVAVADHHREMKSYDFMETESSRFKMPKYEPSPELGFPYGFVAPKSSVPATNAYCSNSFGQLPELRSFEHVNNYAVNESPSSAVASRKRSQSSLPELQSPTTDAYFLASLFKSFEFANNVSAGAASNPSPSPARNTPVDAARKRRYTLSEKTRSLAKLLPWDTKMDSATMLEEAYKYIKFLQAQISVLHSMPKDAGAGAGTSTENPNPSAFNYYGALGRLNRQQLLQVLINSPAAQTALYSRGFCVFSIEQLRSLRKIAGKKLALMNNEPSTGALKFE